MDEIPASKFEHIHIHASTSGKCHGWTPACRRGGGSVIEVDFRVSHLEDDSEVDLLVRSSYWNLELRADRPLEEVRREPYRHHHWTSCDLGCLTHWR